MLFVNNLMMAFRNLRRNLLLTVINGLGLAVGISACLIVFMITYPELNFDSFQPDGDRVYRIYMEQTDKLKTTSTRMIPSGCYGFVRDQFAGVESISRFNTFIGQMRVPDEKGEQKDYGYDPYTIIASPDYFDVFNYYEWVVGSPEGSLSKPYQVVLTESRAKTYFGDKTPAEVIGRQIIVNDSLTVSVSGIVKDITARTDFDFTAFISQSTAENSWLQIYSQPDNWNSATSSLQVFLKLTPGTSVSDMQDRMDAMGKAYVENVKTENKIAFKLQPLHDFHFNASLGTFDFARPIPSLATVHSLIIIASLLLVIAAFNFINLETAQASKRAKEVGLRKSMGSSKKELVTRFLTESFLLCTLAVLFSVALTQLALYFFAESLPVQLRISLFDPAVMMFLTGCVLVLGFVAGIYPAFVLSSFKPVDTLKNIVQVNGGHTRTAFIRKGLTVFQFAFAQILIIVTITISTQIDYMLNKDLGYETNAIVHFYASSDDLSELRKSQALVNELEKLPEVETVSRGEKPGHSSVMTTLHVFFNNGKELIKFPIEDKMVDEKYLSLYGIKLLAGRNFSNTNRTQGAIINETCLHLLGYDDPRDVLGKELYGGMSIIGVMKDFHSKSLHSIIDPIMLSYDANQQMIGVKFSTNGKKVSDVRLAMNKVEHAWKKIYPDHAFSYSFYDDSFARLYENEKRMGRMSTTATGVAVFISCLGLLGLASFTAIQRTKEVAIRKVLGSTVNAIVMLLSKDFLWLVLIAFVIATPVAYYAGNWWLSDFAYHISMSSWIFIISGAVAILIAFITISFRTIGAARANPVESLRYE